MSKFLIEPKCAPGQVLDVDGARTESGTNIHLWKLGEGIHQFFRFVDAGEGFSYIEACHCSDKVIDVSNGKAGNCVNIQLYGKNGTNAQKFRIVDVGDGYYMFKSKINENFCIDVSNGRSDNGTNIWLYTKNDTDSQKFKLINSLDASIKYAKIYCRKRNNKYNFYDGHNCANFCSQCLVAGGVPMTNEWKNGEPAFINTYKLKEYFCNRGVKFIENKLQDTHPMIMLQRMEFFINKDDETNYLTIFDISRGDIVYNGNFFSGLAHAMFVTGFDGNDVIICGNSNDREDLKIKLHTITAVLKTSCLLN